jgi:hypothetical protein
MLRAWQLNVQPSKEMADSNTTGPNYYRRGNIQVWDFIRDQGLNFHLGNAIKYICRAGHKDSRAEDLRKAIHYLTNELETTTGQRIPEKFPGEEQYYSSFTDYAEAFDR